MEEKIRQRIEKLNAQRQQLAQKVAEAEAFLSQTRANILQHDGAIAELSALLAPDPAPAEEAGEASGDE